jgi:dihydroxyacetone kinase DhaK subunit
MNNRPINLSPKSMTIGVPMKKLMNGAENIVVEMCKGFVLAHPELAFNESYKIISRKEKHQNVALISGGGSGHEPAHAGFVGQGMLDAAVCGDVFASPSQIQVYKALQHVATDKGILMIIKNYSGDMMNFQNGAALAAEDGIKVDYVKVADDIAVKDSLYTVGRRGVAGTIFVHKIAGAAASKGLELEEVKAVAQKATDNVISLGFAYTSCTVPAKGTPTFTLADDEMEYGVGIHGEPGIRREKILPSQELAQRIIDDLFLNRPDMQEVAVLVNGFGSTPMQELYAFNNDVCEHLARKGIKIYRTFVGNYMTSIDMNGASVSLLAVDDELKGYLDAEANTPALKMDGSAAQPLIFSTKNVWYCDFGDSPNPQPQHFVEELIQKKQPYILIVDNCGQDTHGNLTKKIQDTQISLLTIEYDVQDDLPESTEVYKLKPNSPEIIKKVIERHYPHINDLNARKIAEFSGGNYRLALAVASNIERSDNLALLTSSELFERLFWQRGQRDDELYKVAQNFALVYSFNLEDEGEENSEVDYLSRFARVDSYDAIEKIEELKSKDIVQQRGK